MMASYAELTGLIIGGAISSGTPVLFAATGEVLAERTGIINLSVEGAMLAGAVTAAWTYHTTNSVLLAVAASALAGGLLGLTHVSLVVLANIGILASGLCLFFVGRGLSAFVGSPIVGKQLTGLSAFPIPLLSALPVAGKALFNQDVLVYFSVLLAFCVWYLLFRTNLGLFIRATGENAQMASLQGVPVKLLRLIFVSVGGSLAGLGGAHIVLGFSHTWFEGVTAGRGWVAIGLVVLARWNPLYMLLIAYLFGGVIALQLNAQASGLTVSPYLLSMLPYLLTIIALTAAHVSKDNSRMPAELTRGNN
jgi:simple sugar transport system permease protein